MKMATRATPAGRSVHEEYEQGMAEDVLSYARYRECLGNIEYTRPEIKGALPDLYPQHYSFTTHTILFLIG